MILSEMETALLARLGVTSTDAFFTTAVRVDLLNEGLQVVSVEADWPWLQAVTTFATVAGTQSYTPPAEWAMTRVLSIDGYRPMEWRSLAEVRGTATTSRDMPAYFNVSAESILLAPVPAATYTVTHDYMVAEAPLVSSGDEPLMPAQFHYAIVAKAAELAHLRQRDNVRAAAQLAEYMSWLVRMRKTLRRSSAPKRVRSYGAGGIV